METVSVVGWTRRALASGQPAGHTEPRLLQLQEETDQSEIIVLSPYSVLFLNIVLLNIIAKLTDVIID